MNNPTPAPTGQPSPLQMLRQEIYEVGRFGDRPGYAARLNTHASEVEAELARLRSEVEQIRRERDEAREALRELHAMVWGECPSLLDEDSGGNSRLDMEISRALNPEPPVEP